MSKTGQSVIKEIFVPCVDACLLFAIAICGGISWKNFNTERKIKYPPVRENAVMVLVFILIVLSLIQLFYRMKCDNSLSEIYLQNHNFITILSCIVIGVLIFILQKKRKMHVPGLKILSDLKGQCVGNKKIIIRVPGEPFKSWDILSNENCGENNIEKLWPEIGILTIMSAVTGVYVLGHVVYKLFSKK